jgi:hypothetical protein
MISRVHFLDDKYSIVSGVIGVPSLQWHQQRTGDSQLGKDCPFRSRQNGTQVRLLRMQSGPNFFILLYLDRYNYSMLLG